MKKINIVVIDGQGGRIGQQLVEKLKDSPLPGEITAVGTNGSATAAMLKAGADQGATGENAVIVACRTADFIVGPIGIVIADSLVGEVTPAMAVAVGQSPAKKVLIPLNQCNNLIVGVTSQPTGKLIQQAVDLIQSEYALTD